MKTFSVVNNFVNLLIPNPIVYINDSIGSFGSFLSDWETKLVYATSIPSISVSVRPLPPPTNININICNYDYDWEITRFTTVKVEDNLILPLDLYKFDFIKYLS